MSDYLISTDFDVTDAIRKHVDDSIEDLKKILPDDPSANVQVILSKEAKGLYHSKFKVRVYKHDLFADDVSNDLYQSINSGKSKLGREILDLKNKFETKKKHG